MRKTLVTTLILSALSVPAFAGMPNPWNTPEENAKIEKEYQTKLTCLEENVAIIRPRIWATGQSQISFTVHNHMDWAISSVTIHAKVVEDGRSTAWYEENVNIDIPGGIEPNEAKEVSFNYGLPEGVDWEKLTPKLEVAEVLDSDRHPYVGMMDLVFAAAGPTPHKCEIGDGM